MKMFRVDTSEDTECRSIPPCHCCRQLDSLDLLHSGNILEIMTLLGYKSCTVLHQQ